MFILSFRNDSSPVGFSPTFSSHTTSESKGEDSGLYAAPGHNGLIDSPGHWSPLTEVSQDVSGLSDIMLIPTAGACSSHHAL